jgi:thiol-disulfide isomerase/thioredoxin
MDLPKILKNMSIKKLFFTISISVFILSCAMADKGYQIDVKVEGLQDTTAFLAYHYGNRQYVKDTVQIDSQGRFTFKGPQALDRGIYMVVLPGQVYFEILVDDNQHFGIETTNEDFVNTMKFRSSPDNAAFYDYMRFIRTQGELSTPLRNEMQDASVGEARKEQIRQQLATIDERVKQEQTTIINSFPNGLFSKILLAQQDPAMPATQYKDDGTVDNDYMYQVYKNNFWNHIDFSDDRLIRTPLFHNKLNQFFTRVIIQHPDSIIVEADRLIEKARAHKEVFKYTVFFITNTFERSQIMGMDAVFVHMVETYYMSGEVDWVTEEQLQTVSTRAMALKPLLLGRVAPDVRMTRPDGRPVNLHSVNAPFTVLYFWDSECGHCKRNTPKLVELYNKMKPKGVEVFAVNTETEPESWISYINQNYPQWINVQDRTNSSGFRDKYDIWSTPLIFLLDKEKKILAKKITVEQLDEIINFEMQKRQ